MEVGVGGGERYVSMDLQEWKRKSREAKLRREKNEASAQSKGLPRGKKLRGLAMWSISMVGRGIRGRTRSLSPGLTRHLSICQSVLP